jgi:hypothetical protein
MLYPCDFGCDLKNQTDSVFIENNTIILRMKGGSPYPIPLESVNTVEKLKNKAYWLKPKTIFTEKQLMDFCRLAAKENNLN